MAAATSWILPIVFGLTFLMIGYGVITCWRSNAIVRRPVDRWIILQGILVFAALWSMFSIAFPLLAWLFWLGDRDHPFWDESSFYAAVVALAYAWFFAAGIVRGRMTRRCVQIHWWFPTVLLFALGAIWVYEWSRDIEGTDPREVAESIVQRMNHKEEVHLVEGPHPRGDFLKGCKTYWIMGKVEARGLVTVCPYGWYWWRLGGTEGFDPSPEVLARAKEWLQRPELQENARLMLENIIKNFPATPEAREAQVLLKARPPE